MMTDRTQLVLGIRPSLSAASIAPDTGSEERFQNNTIRPIISFQNQLLLVVFRNYIEKHKGRFYELNLENKLKYIENAIQRDIKFRNSLKGMIIGQFSVEEYEEYIRNSSSLNKRMMNAVKERLKDQVMLLEEPALIQ